MLSFYRVLCIRWAVSDSSSVAGLMSWSTGQQEGMVGWIGVRAVRQEIGVDSPRTTDKDEEEEEEEEKIYQWYM